MANIQLINTKEIMKSNSLAIENKQKPKKKTRTIGIQLQRMPGKTRHSERASQEKRRTREELMKIP